MISVASWQAQSGAAGDGESIGIIVAMLVICLVLFLFGGKKRR